jgi:methylglyoxal synthase
MEHKMILIQPKKKIALVAHDSKKQDLLEWAKWNKTLLEDHELYATATRADRWVETNRSARRSRKARSTS